MENTFLTKKINKLQEEFLVEELSGWRRFIISVIILLLPFLPAIQATSVFAFRQTLWYVPTFLMIVIGAVIMAYRYKLRRKQRRFEAERINEEAITDWLRNENISTIDEIQFFLDEVKEAKIPYWKFRDTFIGHMYFIFAPLLIAPISSILGLFYADGVPVTDAQSLTLIFLWLYMAVLIPIYINAFKNNDLLDRIRISNNRMNKIELLIKHELQKKLEREKKKATRLANLRSKYRKYR